MSCTNTKSESRWRDRAQHAAGRVMHGIGDEPRRQAALHVSPAAVLQRGLGALKRSAGVGEVYATT